MLEDNYIGWVASSSKKSNLVLVDLPPGKKIVGCKWVYRTKYRVDGSIERHKARLVVQGFIQTECLDFFETFVIKLTIVRLLLWIASPHMVGFFINLMLIIFFYTVSYMKKCIRDFPVGFQPSSSNKVCRLHKSLYGLRQR